MTAEPRRLPIQELFTARAALEHLSIQKKTNNVRLIQSKENSSNAPVFMFREDFILPRVRISFDPHGTLIIAVCRYPILEWFPKVQWKGVTLKKSKNNNRFLMFRSEPIKVEANSAGKYTHNACEMPSFGVAVPVSHKVCNIFAKEESIGLATFACMENGNIDIDDEVSQYVPVTLKARR